MNIFDYLFPSRFDAIQRVDTAIQGRNDFSPPIRKKLKEIGNLDIVSITIQRHPIKKLLRSLLDNLSFGEFEKNNPYDELFHLKLVIKTSNGVVTTLEKEEVIRMNELKEKPFTNSLPIQIRRGMNINSMLDATRSKMGDHKFFSYSAYDNNCQVFIQSVLEANHLNTNETTDFVMQNTKQLFNNLTYLRKFVNTVTDIGAASDVLIQGQGIRIPMSNGMSTIDLNRILKKVKSYNGCFSKDELPKQLKYGWYVINMQNSKDGDGTHWVCFKFEPFITYYDPFGCAPPIEVMQRSYLGLIYNNKQIQSLDSTLCGWFCVDCILQDQGQLGTSHFSKFLCQYSKDTRLNDHILENHLRLLKVIPLVSSRH